MSCGYNFIHDFSRKHSHSKGNWISWSFSIKFAHLENMWADVSTYKRMLSLTYFTTISLEKEILQQLLKVCLLILFIRNFDKSSGICVYSTWGGWKDGMDWNYLRAEEATNYYIVIMKFNIIASTDIYL